MKKLHTEPPGYLASLNDPLSGGKDKMELEKYLQRQGSARILEVGPGSGQCLEKARTISDGWHRQDRYVALDCNEDILKHLKASSSEFRYSTLELIRADATQMPFGRNSFDIIQLSAVVHECFSYGGGLNSVARLIRECSRVLTSGGNLIYRDPEGTDLLKPASLEVNGHSLKVFIALFLGRLLEIRFASPHKQKLYDRACFSLEVDGKPLALQKAGGIFKKAKLPRNSITINAPSGLLLELCRHYITFLDAFMPEQFHSAMLSSGSSRMATTLHFNKKSAVGSFLRFCNDRGFKPYRISDQTYQLRQNEIDEFVNHLDERMESLLQNASVLRKENCLSFDDIEDFLNIYAIATEKLPGAVRWTLPLADLLAVEPALSKHGYEISGVPEEVLHWFEREADEHYFYLSPSQMIAEVLKHSRIVERHDGKHTGYFVLVPTMTEFHPRQHYKQHLERQCSPRNKSLDVIALQGKRTIHFTKVPLELSFKMTIEFLQDVRDISSQPIMNVLDEYQNTIRDYVSRSFNFYPFAKNQEFAFIRELTTEDDRLEQFLQELIDRPGETVDGKRGVCLIGRLGTSKERVRIYLKRHGYKIVSLTDILMDEVSSTAPDRRELWEAGERVRARHGKTVLAERAVRLIEEQDIKRYLILGCRTSEEVEYIKSTLPETIFLGLEASEKKICQALKDRYDVNDETINKWIKWNDGEADDKNTNLQVCLYLCDELFSEQEDT